MKAVVVALSISLGLAAAVIAQEPRPRFGPRYSYDIPDKTDAGSWYGTWVYVSRLHQIAIWMREVEGTPELKLRIAHRSTREMFETDWTSVAAYRHRDGPGRFWLEFDERRSDLITGTWNWRLGEEGSARVDRADFQIWRSGNGRKMTLNLVDYDRWNERTPERRLKLDAAWVFTKAARHHALWAELPL